MNAVASVGSQTEVHLWGHGPAHFVLFPFISAEDPHFVQLFKQKHLMKKTKRKNHKSTWEVELLNLVQEPKMTHLPYDDSLPYL